MNLLTIFEIILGLTIFILLIMYEPISIGYINIKNYIVEDIYASLTSLQYINYTPQDVCNIISNIAQYYQVYINGILVCNNTKEFNKQLVFIDVKNGSTNKIIVSIR